MNQNKKETAEEYIARVKTQINGLDLKGPFIQSDILHLILDAMSWQNASSFAAAKAVIAKYAEPLV